MLFKDCKPIVYHILYVKGDSDNYTTYFIGVLQSRNPLSVCTEQGKVNG